MKEISLNILDIAQNSITANAKTIEIGIKIETKRDIMEVVIIDDGKGMSKELLDRVIDPFTTTRTTRKVGLGLPLFKESVEQTGGSFEIHSELNVGTKVTARYVYSSIDRMPLGDIGETMMLLVGTKEGIRFIFRYRLDDQEFLFDTQEMVKILGADVSLMEMEVLAFIKEFINNGLYEIIGGREIV
ncbi:MAG: ATP-binding protein [Clostridia bacterium]